MVTPERFAKGMTFDEYVRFTGTPEHKERVFGHLRKTGGDIGALLDSPFFDVWAHAGIGEILSKLHERLVVGGDRG
jgi:hypothetical protein